MRAMISGARVSLTTVLLASACAGAQMSRASGEGDDVGESANDETGNDDDDDSASDPSGASTTGTDPTTNDTDPSDPTDPVDDATSDPTDPSDTDPSDTAPTDTDPTADDSSSTDPSATETSESDPSDTDSSDSDAESSSDGGTTDDSATTDATDTEAPDDVDLSGWLLVQTASSRELVIPDGTIVPPGGFLVIGRNSSAASFQDFWGVNWGDEVVYIEGQDNFPTINGAETYTLSDPNDVVIDGPTPALELSTSSARIDAAMAGTADAAWESSPTPNTTAVPGSSDATGGVAGVPYISEYADTTGQGNFDFEFVEVHVPL